MDKHLAGQVPPGEVLAEELEARHWSQAEFAEILGRPTQFVSEIMSAKKEITRESAAQIAAALGTSAEFWLNLQNRYLLSRQAQDTETQSQLHSVKVRAQLNQLAPVSVLRKRGYITGNSLDELEGEIRDLFEIESIDEEPVFAAAARRANPDVPLTPTQKAWLAVARRQARRLTVGAFDRGGLGELAENLARKVRDVSSFADLATLFAAVGVRLVYIEAFPGSKMNGATFLLDDDETQPVIAISGRGKRLDKVLFTLLHELAHLVRGDVRPGGIILIDDGETHTMGDEEATNQLAGEWAIPGGLPAPPRPIRQNWVSTQAERLGVHEIVIVGFLQHHGHLDWRTQLAKGAPSVTEELSRWASA
ncbi:HigA family addiction module antitoxin [Microbacterium luteum]|uniref:HigA family addiction module antitoxin n=1 Tax=Microbacterium TaxID=33882 RepID=UPI0018891CCC|nr:HigA family addiction module antitoxin [Microbacterium luteum]